MKKYREIKHTYQRILKFFIKDIWKLDLSELSILKARVIKYLRVFILTVKGFSGDKIGLWTINLSFYSVMSIAPFVALMFVITKGFGLAANLESILMTSFSENEQVIQYILQFANNIIKSSESGFFGVVTFIFFLWTIIWLMLNIEKAFNYIWKVENNRSFLKRVIYYPLLLLVSPLVVLIFLYLAIIYTDTLNNIGLQSTVIVPVTSVFTWLLFYGVVTFVFSIMYYFIPNVKIRYSTAFNASLIVSVAFVLIQVLYLETQLLVTGLNKVYGVFAAIPLFLIWMNVSWTIILFGAELSHAYSNVDLINNK